MIEEAAYEFSEVKKQFAMPVRYSLNTIKDVYNFYTKVKSSNLNHSAGNFILNILIFWYMFASVPFSQNPVVWIQKIRYSVRYKL